MRAGDRGGGEEGKENIKVPKEGKKIFLSFQNLFYLTTITKIYANSL